MADDTSYVFEELSELSLFSNSSSFQLSSHEVGRQMVQGWKDGLRRAHPQVTIQETILYKKRNGKPAGDINLLVNVNHPMPLSEFFPPGTIPAMYRNLEFSCLVGDIKPTCQGKNIHPKIEIFIKFYRQILRHNPKVTTTNPPSLDINQTAIIFLYNGTDSREVMNYFQEQLGPEMKIREYLVIPIFCPTFNFFNWSLAIQDALIQQKEALIQQKEALIQKKDLRIQKLMQEKKNKKRKKWEDEEVEEVQVKKGKRGRMVVKTSNELTNPSLSSS